MSTDTTPAPAIPAPVADPAAPAPKRRGRPPGSTNKKKALAAAPAAPKGRPGRKPRAAAALQTAEAFAVLSALASDELAAAVHSASPTTRTLIAQILRAGI